MRWVPSPFMRFSTTAWAGPEARAVPRATAAVEAAFWAWLRRVARQATARAGAAARAAAARWDTREAARATLSLPRHFDIHCPFILCQRSLVGSQMIQHIGLPC